jgi:hypothetical protein
MTRRNTRHAGLRLAWRRDGSDLIRLEDDSEYHEAQCPRHKRDEAKDVFHMFVSVFSNSR